MCGIAGILDAKGKRIDDSLLKAMCEAMIHRGPDDQGSYFGGDNNVTVALGHRRLSIIDLKGGHQPIHNENNKIWVVQNGEIYNFLELRSELEKKGHIFYTRSDAEAIIHAYEEYGDDFVSFLRGMFAFALWDESKKKLILARDRIGKKPLLYSFRNNKLIFASEFKAMLQHPEVTKDIDFEAMHHYLTYLCVPGPMTIFKGIKKIPAAHVLIYQDGNIKLKKYWQLDFSKKIKITKKEAAGQLLTHLEEAIKIRLVSDVPLGVLLSGGIDSASVTALMSQMQKEKIRTFSIGFNESGFNELPYAKIIAERFKTQHHPSFVNADASGVLLELIRHYGEPFADSSALPTYYVCKIAHQGVKVVLNGDGGDEVFGGYRRHLASRLAIHYSPMAGLINRSPLKKIFDAFPERPSRPNSFGSIRRFLNAAELNTPQRYMRWIGFFGEDFKRKIYTEELRTKSRDWDSGIFMEDLFKQAETLDSVDAALYVDTLFGLQNDLLVKMDIASMANSLETRSPLLDHKLMEFSASLPSELKIHNFSLKYIFKEAVGDMLPPEILNKPKTGFAIPIDQWFRGTLKNYLTDIILSDKAKKRGYFNPEEIEKIIADHLSGKNNYGQHLWGLLVLELWHREFIDN